MSQLIDNAAEVRRILPSFMSEGRIAFDAEADGLFRYRAHLCTVQLGRTGQGDADDVHTALVDTVPLDTRSELAALLSEDGPEKVVHDAAFDARILVADGLQLGNVFDTSITARYLAEPATGLASLVKKYFEVELTKESQQANWGERPLPDELLPYLENDVRYLIPLAERLETIARAVGVLDEIHTETAYVLKRAMEDPPEPKPPGRRIKGFDKLSPEQKGILLELADLREAEALRQDVPPFRIAHNRMLVELATRAPTTLEQAKRLKGFGRGRARSLSHAFVDAINRATELVERVHAYSAPPSPSPEERARSKSLSKALSNWRKKAAKDRCVDEQVVLPGHCLTEIVQTPPETPGDLADIPGLGECRIDRYGAQILRLIARKPVSSGT